MTKHINAAVLKSILTSKADMALGTPKKVYHSVIKMLDKLPAADVVEVKHGRNLNDTPSQYECSVCGWSCYDTYTGDSSEYNYCPGCGAKMDDRGEDIPPF